MGVFLFGIVIAVWILVLLLSALGSVTGTGMLLLSTAGTFITTYYQIVLFGYCCEVISELGEWREVLLALFAIGIFFVFNFYYLLTFVPQ